jgi:hypothetical protein
MPLLFAPDIVERVEDVATVFQSVVLGAIQPIRTDHVENLILVVVFPLASVADDIAPGRPADPLADAKDGVDIRLEVPPTVPAEDELVGVDVDVLVPHAVVGPVAPRLEVREQAMDPHGRTSWAGGAFTALRLIARWPRSSKRL